VEDLALFWPFLNECLAFFNNFVRRFWPFFAEGLAFFEKIYLATLFTPCAHAQGNILHHICWESWWL